MMAGSFISKRIIFYRKRDPNGNVRMTKVPKNPGQINGNL